MPLTLSALTLAPAECACNIGCVEACAALPTIEWDLIVSVCGIEVDATDVTKGEFT